GDTSAACGPMFHSHILQPPARREPGPRPDGSDRKPRQGQAWTLDDRRYRQQAHIRLCVTISDAGCKAIAPARIRDTMPLSLQSRQVGGITVMTCSGRIVDGPEAAVLKQQFNALLPDRRYIVLDLAEVNFIDSSGLGLLVRLLTRIQSVNGHRDL